MKNNGHLSNQLIEEYREQIHMLVQKKDAYISLPQSRAFALDTAAVIQTLRSKRDHIRQEVQSLTGKLPEHASVYVETYDVNTHTLLLTAFDYEESDYKPKTDSYSIETVEQLCAALLLFAEKNDPSLLSISTVCRCLNREYLSYITGEPEKEQLSIAVEIPANLESDSSLSHFISFLTKLQRAFPDQKNIGHSIQDSVLYLLLNKDVLEKNGIIYRETNTHVPVAAIGVPHTGQHIFHQFTFKTVPELFQNSKTHLDLLRKVKIQLAKNVESAITTGLLYAKDPRFQLQKKEFENLNRILNQIVWYSAESYSFTVKSRLDRLHTALNQHTTLEPEIAEHIQTQLAASGTIEDFMKRTFPGFVQSVEDLTSTSNQIHELFYVLKRKFASLSTTDRSLSLHSIHNDILTAVNLIEDYLQVTFQYQTYERATDSIPASWEELPSYIAFDGFILIFLSMVSEILVAQSSVQDHVSLTLSCTLHRVEETPYIRLSVTPHRPFQFTQQEFSEIHNSLLIPNRSASVHTWFLKLLQHLLSIIHHTPLYSNEGARKLRHLFLADSSQCSCLLPVIIS